MRNARSATASRIQTVQALFHTVDPIDGAVDKNFREFEDLAKGAAKQYHHAIHNKRRAAE